MADVEHTLAKYARGVYAVRVKGRVPEDVEAELSERGIRYRPRDQTDND
jgi:transcription elongation factor SPT4